MLLWTIFKVGLKSLLGNKLRSVLAMLGIIIGVGAVIAMLALGSGVRQQVLDRFASMGSNLLIVMPGQRGTGGVRTGTQQNMTLEDAEAITKLPGVQAVAPGVSGNVQIKYFNQNARTQIMGTSASYFTVRDIKIDRGRMFTETEAERTAHVLVLGPTAATNVFGDNDPINETIKVNGLNFTVIGLSKAKGEGPMSPDDRIIVPYTTAMKQILGVAYLREVDVLAADDADLDQVQADVTALLRKRHRIQEGADSDFHMANMTEIRESVTATADTFRTLLGSIAAISLLVGGIGIMNIMLVSVTERTREIGVRKAIGAKKRNIRTQFLLEAVTISGLGGVIGVVLGVGLARVVPQLLNNTELRSVVEPWSILLSLGFSVLVGVFFGLYPAWRAASLNPIEALRYE